MPNKKSASPIDKHVGAMVRMRRLMLGMSQTELADGLGVTFQQVQKYENGINRIGASRLQQMAHIMNVGMSFFFDRVPAESSKATKEHSVVNEFLSSRDGLALAKAFTRIKDHAVRKRVVELVVQVAPRR